MIMTSAAGVAGGDLAQERSRAALSFAPDSPLLYPDLTVREHLELIGLAHGIGDRLDVRVAELLDSCRGAGATSSCSTRSPRSSSSPRSGWPRPSRWRWPGWHRSRP
jgi:ABC-type multidrug transport system ATPase subunit